VGVTIGLVMKCYAVEIDNALVFICVERKSTVIARMVYLGCDNFTGKAKVDF
jgi:hypothetical protein